MWHLKTFNDVKNPFTTIEPTLIGYYSKLLFTSGEWITDDLNRVCTIQRRNVGLEGKRQKDSISIFVLVWLVHIFYPRRKTDYNFRVHAYTKTSRVSVCLLIGFYWKWLNSKTKRTSQKNVLIICTKERNDFKMIVDT